MNADVRALITKAVRAGWSYLGHTSRHHQLRWRESGDLVVIPSTPSDHRSLRNAEATMARISGPLTPKPGPGRSKAERQRQRERERQRNLAARHSPRRRRATPIAACAPPPRTALQVAFDDYFAAEPAPTNDPIDIAETGQQATG